MSLSLRISRRLRSGKGGSRTGGFVAIAGVALALAIMEITLCVSLGFRHGIEERLSGFDDQIAVLPPIGYDNRMATYFVPSPQVKAIVSANSAGAYTGGLVKISGMLKTDTDFEGLIFTGREPSARRSFERDNIVRGEWPDYAADSTRNDIVISSYTATRLGLDVGDRVFSAFIINDAVKLRRNTVAGIYNSNFGDYDKAVAYASPTMLRSVAAMDSGAVSSLTVNGMNPDDIERCAEAIHTSLLDGVARGTVDNYLPVTTIHRTGSAYYGWLDLLDTNVAVILALMLAVCAFTIVSSLFIIILERVSTIGILRAIGASKGLVRRIFVAIAMRLAFYGMITGNIIGLGLLAIQYYFHIVPLDPSMYYLDAVPVTFNWWGIAALNAGTALLIWLILLVPARLATSVDPAKTVTFD